MYEKVIAEEVSREEHQYHFKAPTYARIQRHEKLEAQACKFINPAAAGSIGARVIISSRASTSLSYKFLEQGEEKIRYNIKRVPHPSPY